MGLKPIPLIVYILRNITGYFYGTNEITSMMFTSGCFTKSGTTYQGLSGTSVDNDNVRIDYNASRVKKKTSMSFFIEF